MIFLTPEEITALGEARNHSPGICTLDGVLDEDRWTKAGNGPLPTPQEIAAAVVAHRAKPREKSVEERLVELSAEIELLKTTRTLQP